MIVISARKKPNTRSTCLPLNMGKKFTLKTVKIATTIPARMPSLVVFFHHRDINIAGPNTAPSPPHAKSTRSYTYDLTVRAIINATIPITSVEILEINTSFF